MGESLQGHLWIDGRSCIDNGHLQGERRLMCN